MFEMPSKTYKEYVLFIYIFINWDYSFVCNNQILLAPPYQIITSLCYIMDENPIDEEKFSAEELASILVNFLTTNNATNSCLSILLSQEVEKTG